LRPLGDGVLKLELEWVVFHARRIFHNRH
jgi:hypothetical protein